MAPLIQAAALSIGTFSTEMLPKPQLETKQKLSSAETLICKHGQHRDTRKHAQSLRVREGSGPAQRWTRDVEVLMASRVHGDVYSLLLQPSGGASTNLQH